MFKRTQCAAVLVLFVLFGGAAFAQFETASLVGIVRDGTGALVAGADVTLTNTETGISQTRTTD